MYKKNLVVKLTIRKIVYLILFVDILSLRIQKKQGCNKILPNVQDQDRKTQKKQMVYDTKIQLVSNVSTRWKKLFYLSDHQEKEERRRSRSKLLEEFKSNLKPKKSVFFLAIATCILYLRHVLVTGLRLYDGLTVMNP